MLRYPAEFAGAFTDLGESDRREVLRAMAASLALAGLAGCGRGGDPEARPYVASPAGETLGEPRLYATAVTFGGYAQPVLGVTHEGRPTKLEGLPEHPACLGAADAFTQAALLGLYDPTRSRGPRRMGVPTTQAAFEAAMARNAARLDARGGEGFVLLTGATSSPTLVRQIGEMSRRWPAMRWCVFEPVGEDLRFQAARLAFGRPLETTPHLDAAEVVVSLDDDLLGPGPRQTFNARGWARARQDFQRGERRSRLVVAETAPTLTGAMADERLIAGSRDVERLALALAAALGAAPDVQPALTAAQTAFVGRCATALRAAGTAGLLTVGGRHAAEIQALALAVNGRLGSLGRAMSIHEPILAWTDGDLAEIAADARAGRIDTLAILDANPVYAAPGDLRFAEALARIPNRIHAGLHFDETARVCQWHAPLDHELETWGDARAVDGRPSLIQPLVRPFYDTCARPVLLQTLQGVFGGDARAVVAETWRSELGGASEDGWRRALELGFIDRPAPALAVTAKAPAVPVQPAAPSGFTVIFRPDPTVWDGRFGANPWLQELPKPFTKTTWDNIIAIAPSAAARAGVESGDIVRLEAPGASVEGPVFITPGLERNSLVVHLGYGRRAEGDEVVGYDAYRLQAAASPWRREGVRLVATGRRMALAITQPHMDLDGLDIVRTAPRSATAPAPPPSAPPSFYPPKPKPAPQWGMAIDTDLCIGCNACVTACDAENNVPMVGKTQVAKGRQMHWLRIDQYYDGPAEDPRVYNQPVPCMHCEQAPCEMGCPVNAAVHSSDGLNLQVYNRCIGTRTCSSYCPYKVRRFNWFDFTGEAAPEHQAARNPEVTVRARGVMEKCTYCVQRIEKARIAAKIEERPIADGEVRTACQQTCPTDAIVFGDISDPDSAVSRAKAQGRNYVLLEEANTRPRTTYLARLADPEDADG